MRIYLNLLFAVLLLSSFCLFAQTSQLVVPKLTGPVVDQANLLAGPDQKYLETRIRGIDQAGGPQIQVLIIKSLNGEAIENYSIKVAEKWQLGEKEKGDLHRPC